MKLKITDKYVSMKILDVVNVKKVVFVFPWVCSCLFCKTTLANVTLASPFANNMVLQREAPIKVWGWASKGEKIELRIDGRSYQTKTNDNGEWSLIINALKVGGPYTMLIKGGNEVQINNILSGDIWFCAGQSNMNFPLKNAIGGAEETSAAANSNIRLLTIPRSIGFTPWAKTKRPPSWLECNPATAADFSAVAYFTGKILNQKLDVPIGLIHCSYGGTIIEDWLPKAYTDTMMAYRLINTLVKGREEQSYFDERNKYLQERFKGTTIFEDEKVLWDTVQVVAPQVKADWPTIQLPAFWEDTKGMENIDGVAWMHKTVVLSANDAKSDAVLSIGKIADHGIVFVNGKQIGSYVADRFIERKYDVPLGLLKEGLNDILVRVTNKRKTGGLWGPSEAMYLQVSLGKKSLTGNWQYWFSQSRANMHPNDMGSSLYNSMVAPFAGFSIKGFIWYQGESNLKNGYQYNGYLNSLISSWRKAWNNEALPFTIIQVPNFKQRESDPNRFADWAVVREAQFKALSNTSTNLVTTLDVGDANDVHPTQKKTVGERTANQLLSKVYHQNIDADGPLYDSFKIENVRIRIFFKNPKQALVFKQGCSTDSVFAIAGADRKFYWAKAVIEKNTLVVWAEQVAAPIAVRYAWANNPCVVLYSNQQVPASPFRTDDWPMTDPKWNLGEN